MTDGIAPIDIAIVGRDPMWVVERMNTIAQRFADAYVREYVTVTQSLDHLTPGYPAVILSAPIVEPDTVEGIDELVTAHPEVAFLFATTNPAGAEARFLTAIPGVGEQGLVDAADLEASIARVEAALLDRRAASRGFGFDDETGLTEAQTAAHAMIVGPASTMAIIAVTGGKGGVGTTSFAINLAAQLARLSEQRVALVDAHGATGDVGFLLGLPAPERIPLASVTIDSESITRFTDPHAPTGLGVVVLPADDDQLASLTVAQLLEVLVALDDHTDIVVIDSPLEVLTASRIAGFTRQVILVSTPHLASLKNTRIAADAIGREYRLGLVVNRPAPKMADPGRGSVEAALQIQRLADLPFDDDIAEGATADPVSSVSDERSKYSKDLARLAKDLLDDAADHLATVVTGGSSAGDAPGRPGVSGGPGGSGGSE